MHSLPLILKFPDWPLVDRELWSRLFETSGLFDDAGKFANWSNPTKRAAKERYGQWLSYLARCHPESLAWHPVDRITETTVRGFISEGEQRVKPVTIVGWIVNLSMIAEVWDPEGDWNWLRRAAKYWKWRGRGAGPKPPFPVSAGQLLAWGLRRMSEVEEMQDITDRERALLFRDALMVGCLIACPVRCRAFAAITITNHLRATEAGFELHFGKEDMKDRKARSIVLTQRLTEPLQQYLGEYRPVLLGNHASQYLWIGANGRPLSKENMAGRLRKVTRDLLGVSLTPHAFRHVAATSVAEYDPEHVGIIRDILGHATLDMAGRYYNRARQVDACNGLQDLARRLKQGK